MKLKEVAALVVLAAVWGGSYLFIRVAVPELGPFPLMAARVVLGAALLALLPMVRRHARDLRRHAPRLLVLGAANAAIPFTLIAAAELHITASLAAILTATVPLFSALINAAFWARQPVHARQAIGLALGLAGVVVLVGWSPLPVTRESVLAMAAVLAAACCYAFAGMYAKHELSTVAPPALALGQQLGAAAWLVAPALFTAPATIPSTPAIVALLALASVSTALAYLLYFYLIDTIGPTRTPMVTYLIPVFGTLWGTVFLRETLTVSMIVSIACVLASVVLVNGARPERLGVQHRSITVRRHAGASPRA